jgi:hypothetical protein
MVLFSNLKSNDYLFYSTKTTSTLVKFTYKDPSGKKHDYNELNS